MYNDIKRGSDSGVNSSERVLIDEILERVRKIYLIREEKKRFIPGVSKVHYAGRVFDDCEMTALVSSALEFMLTLGCSGEAFEEKFSKYLGVQHSLVVNSGSSANLLAVSTLCSPRIDNPLKPGDEVITTAATFPTTLAPIIQNNLVPVFVDVDPETYNIDPELVRQALSDRSRALCFAHTLGNPADMDSLTEIVSEHNLYLIEDTCDALDSKYGGKLAGTFGDISTFSFYAAHHITMGEGGAVAMRDTSLYRNALSIRDWGRACWCPTGEKRPLGACENRFNFRFEGLPEGYDHKYTYTNIGYNLKPLDLQCAIGLEQLEKLPEFTRKRQYNFGRLYEGFREYEDYFTLPSPYPKSEPSWFAFPVTVRENPRFTRNEIVRYFEDKNIETRMLFGGNILRHPGYRNINHRVSGSLVNSDNILLNTFFLGVYPGLTEEMIQYILDSLRNFFK